MTTVRPWKVIDYITEGKTANLGYIEIRGPNDEAVCTMFPSAGKGGVGIEIARKNAALIVTLANATQDDGKYTWSERVALVRSFNEWTPEDSKP